MRPDLCLV